MADRLHVYLSGEPIGIVERLAGGRYQFTYSDDYRKSGGVPLSPTLPVGVGPFRSGHIEAYLEGLLPEKPEVRRGWAAALGTGNDAFDLLGSMGLDCVGAVQFVKPGDEKQVSERSSEYRPWTDRMIAERLNWAREPGCMSAYSPRLRSPASPCSPRGCSGQNRP
jgi:serine/threonine-protein kinase HipA